jgi:hypothetical protein
MNFERRMHIMDKIEKIIKTDLKNYINYQKSEDPKWYNWIDDYAKDKGKKALIWFLAFCYPKNMKIKEEIDEVCTDGPNDYGIDGLWYDDEENTVEIIMVKFWENSLYWDTLRDDFYRINRLLNSTKNNESRNANIRLQNQHNKIKSKKFQFNIKRPKYVFHIVSRRFSEKFRSSYQRDITTLENEKSIIVEIWDEERLLKSRESSLYSTDITTPQYNKTTYFIPQLCQNKVGIQVDEAMILQEDMVPTKTIIALVDFLKIPKVILDAAENRSLYSRNVREYLGRTKIAKYIEDTLSKKETISYMPIFNNGIIIATDRLEYDPDKKTVYIENFGVVNGCQTFETVRNWLKKKRDDAKVQHNIPIRLIFRFIKNAKDPLDENSQLIDRVTICTNNQNKIMNRDLYALNTEQIRLSEEIKNKSKGLLYYCRRKGDERYAKSKSILDNRELAQMVAAWIDNFMHNSYKKDYFFSHEERYNKIFNDLSGDTAINLYELDGKFRNFFDNIRDSDLHPSLKKVSARLLCHSISSKILSINFAALDKDKISIPFQINDDIWKKLKQNSNKIAELSWLFIKRLEDQAKKKLNSRTDILIDIRNNLKMKNTYKNILNDFVMEEISKKEFKVLSRIC